MFVLTDATGIGAGDIDSNGSFVDLIAIANDTGLGLDAEVAGSGRRRVTYAPSVAGVVQTRLDLLVNTAFMPDYGAGPQAVDIVVVSVPDDFVFGDGSFGVVDNGTALPPTGSGLAGAGLNPTSNCLVLYDTALNICVARDGTGGTLDLSLPGPVTLYHELSHATRIVQNGMLSLAGGCDPSSPEENAAIIDENDMRTQFATLVGGPVVLRDPGNHCGGTCPPATDDGCCIVATVASGSTRSSQVRRLRRVRDRFVRRTESGFAFFEQLFDDYYAFSPQVSGMIAGQPQVRDAVLRGYVEPLLDFWELLAARADLVEPSDAELGRLFLDHAPSTQERMARLDAVAASRAWWDAGGAAPVPDGLLDLLRERAWTSEAVRWALMAPLDVYERALRDTDGSTDPQAIGAVVRGLLDEWSPGLPIAALWGTLSTDEAMAELALCDAVLLQTEPARDAFRARLMERFGDVTAVRVAVRADLDEPPHAHDRTEGSR